LYATFNVGRVKEKQIIVREDVSEELKDLDNCLIVVVETDGFLNQKYN